MKLDCFHITDIESVLQSLGSISHSFNNSYFIKWVLFFNYQSIKSTYKRNLLSMLKFKTSI